MDNAILRLNFKVKRTDEGEDVRRRIFCERCCTRGRVRFNMRTSSAKNGTKLKFHGKGKKKKLNGGTFHPFKMHHGGIVPAFKMLQRGLSIKGYPKTVIHIPCLRIKL